MPITPVGTATTATNGSSASITVNKPSAVASGDIMIAVVQSRNGAVTSSGWTAHTNRAGTVTTDLRVTVLWKQAGGSEPSNYTFTAGGGSSGPIIGMIVAYAGVDATPGNPFLTYPTWAWVGPVSEPASGTTLSPAAPGGRACAFRCVRISSASTTITFSNPSGDSNSQAQAAIKSSGSSYIFATGFFDYTTKLSSGSSLTPQISHNHDSDESDSVVGAFVLREATPAPEGTLAADLPKVDAAVTAERQVPAGDLAADLPKVDAAFTGNATPPEGPLDAELPKVSSSFTATSTGGPLAASLPKVNAAIDGGTDAFGPMAATLPLLSAGFTMETSPFGEHVIRVEREDRAFLVTDDGNGLIPLKRSKVTQQ